jgi:tetratricopeptide (TPR) repeat protein
MRIRRWLGKALERSTQIASLPLKTVERFVSRGIGLFHFKGGGTKDSWTRKVLLAPFRVLAFPFVLALGVMRSRKPSEILIVLPSLLMLGLLSLIGYRVLFSSDTIQRNYFLGARRAVTNNDLPLALRYFDRIAEKGEMSDQMNHDWAVVLNMSGEEKRADQLLTQIAPDDAEGLPIAHRTRAIRLAGLIEESESSPDQVALDQLHWHLQHAVSGPQTDQVWASYFIHREQPEEAIRYLNTAANEFPQLYFTLANLCEEIGREPERVAALSKARDRFSDTLNRDALNQSARMSLAKTFVELGKDDAAEKVIFTGMQIFKTPQWTRVASDFLVRRSRSNSAPIVKRYEMISRALAVDNQNRSVFDALVGLCRDLKPDDRKVLKSLLLEIVTGDLSSSLAHLCLASQYHEEGSVSEWKWHLQQSRFMDSQFELLASNLAMSFASRPTPDFDWALELIEDCIDTPSGNAEYRVRKAEILLLQGSVEEAVRELNATLESSNGPEKLIYERLSFAYRQIGDLNQARIYASKANEIE